MQPDQHDRRHRDAEICGDGRNPGLRPCPHHAERQSVLAEEDPGGADAEHHHRMTVEPVLRAAPPWQRAILADGERMDVAGSALVEIAGGGVMDGMGAAPVIVRREGEDADGAAGPVVGAAPREQSAMAAIVLQGEKPDQKSGRRDGQQKPPPVTVDDGKGDTAHNRANGSTVTTISIVLRAVLGRRYWARILVQERAFYQGLSKAVRKRRSNCSQNLPTVRCTHHVRTASCMTDRTAI